MPWICVGPIHPGVDQADHRLLDVARTVEREGRDAENPGLTGTETDVPSTSTTTHPSRCSASLPVWLTKFRMARSPDSGAEAPPCRGLGNDALSTAPGR